MTTQGLEYRPSVMPQDIKKVVLLYEIISGENKATVSGWHWYLRGESKQVITFFLLYSETYYGI